jgi:hypothetical protein
MRRSPDTRYAASPATRRRSAARDRTTAVMRGFAHLADHIVCIVFAHRPNLPTTRKRRFIDADYLRKLFEVYFMDNTPLAGALEAQLIAAIAKQAPNHDVVVVARSSADGRPATDRRWTAGDESDQFRLPGRSTYRRRPARDAASIRSSNGLYRRSATARLAPGLQ